MRVLNESKTLDSFPFIPSKMSRNIKNENYMTFTTQLAKIPINQFQYLQRGEFTFSLRESTKTAQEVCLETDCSMATPRPLKKMVQRGFP